MEGEQNNAKIGGVEEEGDSNGLIIGAIIILAIIILGGIYFWNQRVDENALIDANNLQQDFNGVSATGTTPGTTDTKNLDAELNAS